MGRKVIREKLGEKRGSLREKDGMGGKIREIREG